MRQFKLWNYNKSASFDFASQGIIITEVAGLGINYSAAFNNRALVQYEREFEPITLLANFGINANAYTAFTTLANFIITNGKNNLVLEYHVNDRTVYADVWLTRMPKSQKTNFNILAESLQFTRVTPWYVEIEGTVTSTPLVISNTTLTDVVVNLTIKGATSSDFAVKLTKVGASNPTSEIRLNYTLSDAYIIKIDADNKKVERIVIVGNAVTNGYNFINKAYDSFIIVPPGSYQLTHTGTAAEVTCNYKGWVID